MILDTLEKSHLLKRKKASSKVVDYVLTKQGFERKKVLNMTYLSSTQKLYESAKENIENFLLEIKNKGYKDILLYGAGEVCEILLNTLKSNKSLDLKCNAIIDDDTLKIGNHILDIPIIDIKNIDLYKNEGILISSYKHKDNIIKKLINIHYDSNNIINFFE
jgi:FlaA1/EpsC-like NDP-sugar epimerase